MDGLSVELMLVMSCSVAGFVGNGIEYTEVLLRGTAIPEGAFVGQSARFLVWSGWYVFSLWSVLFDPTVIWGIP
jgi:hypothetical protein